MDAIIDTSVVIEIFRGNNKVLKTLLEEKLVYSLSAITLFEIYCGSLKEREVLMIEKMPKLNFDEKSARMAGNIFKDLKKKGKIPSVDDLLIAANAIAFDKILFTCDKDFDIFRDYGLKLKILTK